MRPLLVFTIAILLVGVSGCFTESTKAPVRIGVIVPLSGGLAAFGESLGLAALVAQREVRAAGGLLDGRDVEVLVEDSGTDPDQALQAAERLIRENDVHGIVGPASSASVLAVQELTRAEQVPQISCCATSDDIATAQPTGDRYLLRTVPTDSLQARVLAPHAQSIGCTQLAIMHLNDAYGEPFGQAIEEAFVGLGGTVVDRVGFQPMLPSYATEVERVALAEPNCIALVAFAASGGTILREWNELGSTPDVTWIATDGMKTTDVVREAGGAAAFDGVIGTAPISAPATPQYGDFEANYYAAFSQFPLTFASNQFDAMALLMLAVEAAQGRRGAPLRDALRQVANRDVVGTESFFGPGELDTALIDLRRGQGIDYEGASGHVDLDAQGEVISDYEIWRYDQVIDGFMRLRVIRAEDIDP
jgi:neutral amino acid transport system substrate-binding protein